MRTKDVILEFGDSGVLKGWFKYAGWKVVRGRGGD